jgi:type I restriction-modification system DNA methylase subunit
MKEFQIDTNFQTPLDVCNYMVDMIPADAVTVWEPTPGMGNIVSVLVGRNKYKVTTADDFFLVDKTERFDCIVMNPPFSSKTAFIDNAPADADIKGMKLGYYMLSQCMEMSDHVIALMPWFTIADSDVRARALVNYGLKSLTILPRKTFQYARIQTVVIELEKGFNSDTIFQAYKYK